MARTGQQRAQAFEARATMHHLRGEPEAAADALAKGLAALPADAELQVRITLMNMRAVVLRRAARTDDARELFEQTLVLARRVPETGDLPAVLNNLGLLVQDLDDHLGAIALMQEAADRQTDPLVRARVINNLGVSLEERGQAAMAREQCLAAARLVQGAAGVAEINLAIRLGAIARTLGRWRDALAHLDRAEQLLHQQPNKREVELHRVRAALWLDLGRPNLAREALDRAAAVVTLPVEAAELAPVQARLALLLGQDALALLRPAEQVLQAAQERRMQRRVQLVMAQALEPEAALALMQALAADAALRDNAAAALPVEVRQAQALLALQRPAEALRHAQRAADWLQAVRPVDIAPPEVWLTLARCALAAGDPGQAAIAAARGAAELQRNAREQLEPAFHDSYLQRNPVNRDLLNLADRLARDAAA